MVEFLLSEFGEGALQKCVVRVAEQQTHRIPRGLLLAMGVVDEESVDVLQRAIRPRGARFGSQVQHGAEVTS